jgi:hypothetical protein
VTARVRTDVVQSLRHQRRNLHQSTYPVLLGRSGLILLSSTPTFAVFIVLGPRGSLLFCLDL